MELPDSSTIQIPCSGVLVAQHQASLVILGHSYFEGNGVGAIVLDTSSPSLISGDAIFIENDSGMLVASSALKLEGHIQFSQNHGQGCINAAQSNITINATMVAKSNKAISGSVINAIGSQVYMYGEYHQFSENTANDDGGSIFALQSEIELNGDTSHFTCLLYTSPSPRDATLSRMPSSA